MRKSIFLVLVSFTVILSACSGSAKKQKDTAERSGTILFENSAISQEIFNPAENGYRVVWEDNFDGNSLDLTKWNYRATGPRRIGYNSPSMVKVNDGHLHLMFDVRNDSVLGAMIGTQSTFMSRYGYYECRSKVQKCSGPWAAFWIQSTEISKGEDPAIYGAEIDIFEYFQNDEDRMTHCVHWAYGPNQKSVGQLVSTIEGLSNGFHTYGLEWTPEKYAFYIDGLKFHEITEGLSHIDEYMILSMEIPSSMEALENSCPPDTFVVDYVKVYASAE